MNCFLRYRQCYIVAGSTLPELFFSTLMQWKSQARECSSSSILIWPSYFTWKTPTPLKPTGLNRISRHQEPVKVSQSDHQLFLLCNWKTFPQAPGWQFVAPLISCVPVQLEAHGVKIRFLVESSCKPGRRVSSRVEGKAHPTRRTCQKALGSHFQLSTCPCWSPLDPTGSARILCFPRILRKEIPTWYMFDS